MCLVYVRACPYTQLYGPCTLALTNCTRHKRCWPFHQPIQPSTNLLWDYLNLNVLRKLQAAQQIDSVIPGAEPPLSYGGTI